MTIVRCDLEYRRRWSPGRLRVGSVVVRDQAPAVTRSRHPQRSRAVVVALCMIRRRSNTYVYTVLYDGRQGPVGDSEHPVTSWLGHAFHHLGLTRR